MDLIVGRDGKTSQLNVIVGKKIYQFFAPGSVPIEVSRQHCLITVLDNGKYTVRNIKTTNVTYINGLEIEEKTVTDDDRIELGRSRYLLNLSYIIDKITPRQQEKKKIVDITPLQTVWDDYISQDLKLQKHQKNIGLLASVPMGLTMLGGVITGLCEPLRPYAIFFTAIALTIMIYGFYKRYTDDTLEKRQRLRLDFQQKYVCPNTECRHFLGNTPYPSLKEKGSCPYCKAIYQTPTQS